MGEESVMRVFIEISGGDSFMKNEIIEKFKILQKSHIQWGLGVLKFASRISLELVEDLWEF
jgi:hypothetical protein